MKSNGIGFFGMLGITFIILKICNIIDWSWWLVTLPLWGIPVLVFGILILFFLMVVVNNRKSIKYKRARNKKKKLK